jgi:PleD family two-component response regulator
MVRAAASTHHDASTLLRDLLTQSFGDDALVRHALSDAMLAARRLDLPSEPDELMRFAWAYLMTPIAETAGVRAATKFITDLQNALTSNQGSFDEEPHSETRVPVVSDVRAIEGDSHQNSQTERPSARTKAARRLSVLLVDSDRLGRSSLARALVQARIDVNVADGLAEAAQVLEDLAAPLDVVLADADSPDFDRLVSRVQLRRPSLRIIARARPPASANESGTRPVRPGLAAMVWKNLRAAELIEQIRHAAWDALDA